MNVQSIERTFMDKVFAVCDYKIQNMQDRDSRHLYDICNLKTIHRRSWNILFRICLRR